MFTVGDVYTHRNMLDTAILVLSKSFIRESDDFVLKVRWVLKSGVDLGQNETIVIRRKDAKNWRLHGLS